ncbi:MAG: DUF4142 domain-containing protein [Acidobacteriaceae bacterium]
MKQIDGSSFFRAVLLVPALMLLTIMPAAIAQMHGGSMGGSQNSSPNNNMNNPNGTMAPDGMQPMGAPNSAQNAEQMMQRNIFDNLRRNFDVETKLSKMAMKNSTNDDVKKFAQQVISANRGLSNELIVPNPDGLMFNPEVVPNQTRKAEKQMKKMTGTPFDQMYLVQMNAYVKNDRQVAQKASSMGNSAKVNEVGVRVQSMSDERETQIASLTKEDGFTIK